MRLFIAVELRPPALIAATQVSRALEQRVSHLAPSARLTWVPTERLHLTIRFLGEVDPAGSCGVQSVLAAPLDTAAFTLTMGGAGAFPRHGSPRVLWLGIEQGLVELKRLEQEVSGRLEAVGFPPESRPFNPHLTLARVRDPAGLRLPALLDGLAPPGHAGSTVDAITLFESRLSPKGPTYTPLQRALLGPG